MKFKKGQLVMTPIYPNALKVLKVKGDYLTVKMYGKKVEVSASTARLLV